MRLIAPISEKKEFKFDFFLFALLAILAVCSIVAIYCALPLVPLSRVTGLLEKQIIWFILGFITIGILLYIGIERFVSVVNFIYVILLIMLFMLILDRYSIIDFPFITSVQGAYCWFQIPGIGTFQPSEFMKVILIFMTAQVIDNHNKTKLDNSYLTDIKLFLKVFAYVLPPLFLITLQPDTGIPIIIVVSILVMLACSGIRRAWVILGVAGVLIGLFGVVYLFKYHPNILAKLLGAPYKLNRFYGWLETEKFISSYGDQLYKGLLAIGSAGLSGHDLRSALVYFAEPQNDFIFAVIGQNFGYLGTAFIVLLCTVLDLKLLSITIKSTNNRHRYIMMGVLGMLLFQQFQNMGMITGLLPITGITLPFISSGGSSLISYMIPIAIAFQMSSDTKVKKKY